MRVAVMSGIDRVGKSTFIYLLASVFSRSHQQFVSIMSTKPMGDALQYVNIKDRPGLESEAGVFRALLETGTIMQEDIFDYGLRVGSEEVYAFDVLNTTLEARDAYALFLKVLDSLICKLILVEIKSDLQNNETQKLLRHLDIKLFCFDMSPTGFKSVEQYRKTMPEDIVSRTGYVCCKYDDRVMSEKEVAKNVGISVSNLMCVPYNPTVIKEELVGTMDTMAKYIISGQSEVVPLRVKMKEIMSYIFDMGPKKQIKGLLEWHK